MNDFSPHFSSLCLLPSVLPLSLGEAAAALQPGGYASHPQEDLQGAVWMPPQRLSDWIMVAITRWLPEPGSRSHKLPIRISGSPVCLSDWKQSGWSLGLLVSSITVRSQADFTFKFAENYWRGPLLTSRKMLDTTRIRMFLHSYGFHLNSQTAARKDTGELWFGLAPACTSVGQREGPSFPSLWPYLLHGHFNLNYDFNLIFRMNFTQQQHSHSLMDLTW